MKRLSRSLAGGLLTAAALCGGIGSAAAAGHNPTAPTVTPDPTSAQARTMGPCASAYTAAYYYGIRMGWGPGLSEEYADMVFEACIIRSQG